MFTGARPERAVAGPFGFDDLRDFPVPADKKLDAKWIASLTSRGEETVYSSRRNELGYIGMPIGGICAGQVYLGGDGKLWLWDIFNQPASATWNDSSGPHYAKPVRQSAQMVQGFGMEVGWGGRTVARHFDTTGWTDISFRGQYPIGLVEYKEQGLPVEASLEAFSPYCPLDADDSGIPAIVMNFTVRNVSSGPADVAVAGWMQNAVLQSSAKDFDVIRQNRISRQGRLVSLECSGGADPRAEERKKADRQEIVFDRFESEKYEGWTTTGEAFGDGPRKIDSLPGYMGPVKGEGGRVVNSHHTQNGEDVGKADTYLGTLTSRTFTIERNFISFRLGGGKHPAQTCVNLLIDGAPVRTTTGRDSNIMDLHNWDVKEFAGRKASIQLVDGWSGAWGQISLDDVVFCDSPRKELGRLEDQPDNGTLSLGMIVEEGVDPAGVIAAEAIDPGALPASAFGEAPAPKLESGEAPTGSVGRRVRLKPGESATFSFVIGWHFERPWRDHFSFLAGGDKLRRRYGTRYKNASEVVGDVAGRFALLSGRTRDWHDCWYNSSLPWWFLNRTMVSASTLATNTCYRFDNDRFYAWEGTYCCAGTCTHVWSYAQSVGRLFPQLERSAREMADYGVAFHDDTGAMDYRAEGHKIVAHDGQCGTILRTYREHQMSADNAFLTRVWPRVKKAVEHMIREDKNLDGLLEGAQYNTLDTVWYGEMAWMSSYYIAMLRAAAEMASDIGDAAFGGQCRKIADSGTKLIVERLFNGEYFIHHPDPAHPEANNTNDGCHTDQMMGQAWAWQVGLDRVVPREESVTALKSMWKYCFTPDVGPYRDAIKGTVKGGRWYAMPGEGGLIVCTFPKGGAERCVGKGNDAWAAGYFNECWTGFEFQVAGHMIYEGLVTEGMAICRMIEDRHHASKRNPWNEVECSSHYARGMSSHGAFLAACGFEYHGPKGHIGFAPRVGAEDFKAAFTGAEGWGRISQKVEGGKQRCEIAVKYGRLRLRTVRVAGKKLPGVSARIGKRELPVVHAVFGDGNATISFGKEIEIPAGEALTIEME